MFKDKTIYLKYLMSVLLLPLILLFFLLPKGASAAENEQTNTHFMTYYRVWQDKNIVGKADDKPGSHWMTMHDIPYGLDIVNVFGGIPDNDENFYNILKNEYAPELHARGVTLIRGVMYPELLKVPMAGVTPTQAEIDAYAKTLYENLVVRGGLDGIDIDMEQHPTAEQVKISDAVINALSKYVGPKANNGTTFVYDTNGETMPPFKNVSDCFDYLGYQQYGGTTSRTENMINNYSPYLTKDQIIPGLAFAEAGGADWGDTHGDYENSHMYNIAKYVHDQQLGGMFVYAIDRDGKTASGFDDLNNSPSNFLWTKTVMMEARGWTVDTAKDLAKHNVNRVKYAKGLSQDNIKNIEAQIDLGTNLFDVDKAVMRSSEDFSQAVNSNFDPALESDLQKIDTTQLAKNLDNVDLLLAQNTKYQAEGLANLQKVRDEVANNFAGKSYTSEQVNEWNASLETKMNELVSAEIPVQTLSLGVSGIQAVKCGTTLNMLPTVTPEDATNKTITWSYSKEGIVSIDDQGALTAVKPGIVKVTAMAGTQKVMVTIRVTK
jgi:hexosaminidase